MEDTYTYLQRIWDIGLNIVSCGECPAVLIVERAEEHTCRFCGFTDDISGFGDFFTWDYDTAMKEVYKVEEVSNTKTSGTWTAEDFLRSHTEGYND
tara:strand:- start:2166 stop:2453 length:288 start_codon:yes stop_codon:yes gene_type:complete